MIRISRDRVSTIFQVLLVIFLFGYSVVKGHPDSKENTFNELSTSVKTDKELQTQMIDLWKQHVAWNRNVMLCIVDELPGTTQAVNRLQQNKIEIGNAIKPYYGTAKGNELTRLLQAHVSISVEVMLCAKEKKHGKLQEANARWYANAAALAAFLGNLNDYWASDKIQLIIQEQLSFTTTQAICRINKDYAADIVAYDKAQANVIQMADVFADGIAYQFPEKMDPVSQVLMITQ
jgi:hypothetical protein